MMRSLLLSLACLLASSIGFAGEHDAFNQVAKAKLFAFGGIGFAGTTTESEVAFREIRASGTAEADFLRLLREANPQGQSYALVGLRLSNFALFQEQVKPFLGSSTNVETAGGCMLRTVKQSELAAEIKAGHYDESARREIAKPPIPAQK